MPDPTNQNTNNPAGVPLTPPDPSATNPVQPPMSGMGSLANIANQFMGGGGLGGLAGLLGGQGGFGGNQFPNGQRPINFRPDVPSPGPWRQPWTLPPVRNSGWGQSNWMLDGNANYPGNDLSPSMPSPMEAINIIGGAGRQLSQFAPPGPAAGYGRASQLAMQLAPWLDMLSKGAFSKNYAAARLGLLKQKEEEMVLNAAQARQAHQEILQKYDDIIATFNAGGYGEGLTGEQKATEELIQAANAAPGGPDQHLINIIANKGIGAAGRFLADQDQRLQAMWAGEMATTKSSSTNAADPYSETTQQGLGGVQPRAEIMHPDVTPTGPAGPGPDVATPAATGSNIMDEPLRKQFGLNAAGAQLAHDALQDPSLSTKHGNVDNARAAMEVQIQKIANDPNMTEEEKLSRIGAIDSGIGNQLRGTINYSLDPKDPNSKIRSKIQQLATAVTKGKYQEGNYANLNKYSNPDQPESKVIEKAQNIPQQFVNLIESLNKTLGDKSIPQRVIHDWINGNITGHPEYDAIYNNLFVMANQLNGVLTLTGTPRVTLVHDWLRHLSQNSSPESIRTQVLNDMKDVFTTINGYQHNWERTGRRNDILPGMPPEAYAAFRAIVRMDPRTGTFPSGPDVPYQIKNISRPVGRGRSPPLEMDQIHKLTDFIKMNERSTDAPTIKAVQDAQKILGTTFGLGEYIQGVDPDAGGR